MSDLDGMDMAYLSPRLYRLARIAAGGRWGRLYSTPTGEFLAVGITGPTLGVLAAWLASAQGLPPTLIQVVAMIPVLVLALPSMLRLTLYSSPTETDDTLFIAPTNLAEGVENSSDPLDSKEWYGLMENLTSPELAFLTDLVDGYLEKQDDLSQPEWGFAHGILDKLNLALDVVHDH